MHLFKEIKTKQNIFLQIISDYISSGPCEVTTTLKIGAFSKESHVS